MYVLILRPFAIRQFLIYIGDAKNEFQGFSYPETRQRPTYRSYKSEKNEFPVSRIDLVTSFRAETRNETNTKSFSKYEFLYAVNLNTTSRKFETIIKKNSKYCGANIKRDSFVFKNSPILVKVHLFF